MRRSCSDIREIKRRFGENAELLVARLALLLAAERLVDLENAPGKFHALTGDRSGQFALSLRGPHRLIFEIADEPLPVLDDGGTNLSEVRRVRILEVAQYHG
jgi:proteic killer suppression protein